MDALTPINLVKKDILHRLVWAAMIKNESIKKSPNLSGSLNRMLLQRKMWFSLIQKIQERRNWAILMKQIEQYK